MVALLGKLLSSVGQEAASHASSESSFPGQIRKLLSTYQAIRISQGKLIGLSELSTLLNSAGARKPNTGSAQPNATFWSDIVTMASSLEDR
jgi:hypothetical protein